MIDRSYHCLRYGTTTQNIVEHVIGDVAVVLAVS
eukprot:COSAG01_NODE_66115_length_271_cov_0.604651_1_plen_33_part_10